MEPNRVAQELARMVDRAANTWSWWVILASIAYFAVRFYPWALGGFGLTV